MKEQRPSSWSTAEAGAAVLGAWGFLWRRNPSCRARQYGSSVRRCPDPAMGSRQQDRKVTSGSGLEPTALGFTADGGVGEGGTMHESSVCDSVCVCAHSVVSDSMRPYGL